MSDSGPPNEAPPSPPPPAPPQSEESQLQIDSQQLKEPQQATTEAAESHGNDAEGQRETQPPSRDEQQVQVEVAPAQSPVPGANVASPPSPEPSSAASASAQPDAPATSHEDSSREPEAKGEIPVAVVEHAAADESPVASANTPAAGGEQPPPAEQAAGNGEAPGASEAATEGNASQSADHHEAAGAGEVPATGSEAPGVAADASEGHASQGTSHDAPPPSAAPLVSPPPVESGPSAHDQEGQPLRDAEIVEADKSQRGDDDTAAFNHLGSEERRSEEPIRLPYNMQNVRGTSLLPNDGACQSPVYDRLVVDSKFWAAVASILAVKGRELQQASAPLTALNVAKLAAKHRRQHEVFTTHVQGTGSSHLSSAALSIILEEQGVPCSERLAAALIRRVAHGQPRVNEAQFVTLMVAVHGAILRRVAAEDLKHGAPAPGTTLSVDIGEPARSRSRSRSPGAGLFTPPLSVSEGRNRRSLSPRSGTSSFSVSYTPDTVTSKHRELNAPTHAHSKRDIESRSRPWREPLVSPVVKLVHDRMLRRARSPPPTLLANSRLVKEMLARDSRSPARAGDHRARSPVQVKGNRTQLPP